MRFIPFAATIAALMLAAVPARASSPVTVRVSKSEQLMRVYVEDEMVHAWKVSTGARGYKTPIGSYSVKRMHTMWRSRRYNDAPMPHALFFTEGWAVHGTTSLGQLGRPASHGCVRLHPDNARTLFGIVSSYGRDNTRIVVTN